MNTYRTLWALARVLRFIEQRAYSLWIAANQAVWTAAFRAKTAARDATDLADQRERDKVAALQEAAFAAADQYDDNVAARRTKLDAILHTPI